MEKLTYIDLFAGAGGLSEGFIREGFIPVAHAEMNADACLTLKTRIAYHYLKDTNKLDVYHDYQLGKISRETLYNYIPERLMNSVLNYEITEDNIYEVFSKIDELMKISGTDKIKVIIGGPPCQAYSLVGRARVGDSIKNDKRNYLFMLYGRFLEKYNPDIFVFENVPGLLSAGKGEYFEVLKSYFAELGYDLDNRALNSADFGVLQSRKRIIIIGWKKELGYSYPEFEKTSANYTINDLFEDLPKIKAGDILQTTEYIKDSNQYLLDSNLRNGFKYVTQHEARPHIPRDLRIYKRAIEMWNNEKKRLKYGDIPEEDRTHKNVSAFIDRFKVVDGNGLSHTVVAHISKDGHYYIHPDINQLRSISIREAARIQSFPDDYYFEKCRTSAFKQIGNAVPPLMAQKIANKIKSFVV